MWIRIHLCIFNHGRKYQFSQYSIQSKYCAMSESGVTDIDNDNVNNLKGQRAELFVALLSRWTMISVTAVASLGSGQHCLSSSYLLQVVASCISSFRIGQQDGEAAKRFHARLCQVHPQVGFDKVFRITHVKPWSQLWSFDFLGHGRGLLNCGAEDKFLEGGARLGWPRHLLYRDKAATL